MAERRRIPRPPETLPTPQIAPALEDLMKINLANFPMFMSLFAYPSSMFGAATFPPEASQTLDIEVEDGWYELITGAFQDVSRNGAMYVHAIADDDRWAEIDWYVTGSMMNTPITFSPPLLVADSLVVTYRNTAAIPVTYSNFLFGYAIREEYFKPLLKFFEKYLGFKVPAARRRKIE